MNAISDSGGASGGSTRERDRTKAAVRLSIGYGVFVVVFTVAALYCDAGPQRLQEWGDWFAGAASPLAFAWLVVGYFQQGEELRQNTEALQLQAETLKLQVKEIKQSVEEQKNMARAAIRHARSAELALLMQFQPDIQCIPVHPVQSWPAAQNQGAVAFALMNQGRTAQQCSIIRVHGAAVISGVVPETWEAGGETHRIAFTYSGGFKGSFQFSVVYTDGFGFPQKSTFRVHLQRTRDHDGHISIGVHKLPVRPRFFGAGKRKAASPETSDQINGPT